MNGVLLLVMQTSQLHLSFLQIVKLAQRLSLCQNPFILCELLLLKEVQQFDYRRTSKQHKLQAIIHLKIGTLEQLLFQVNRQARLHLFLKHKTPLLLLKVLTFKVISELVLLFLTNLQIVHVSCVEIQLGPKVIFSGLRLNDGSNDIVDHIAVCHQAKAKTSKTVGNLLRVVRSDISVTNRSNRVDSPVKRVKVTQSPSIIHDRRIRSGRIQPTYYNTDRNT